ncbi:peptide/nickel transport system permease protein [Nakamurella sp. UYEF19]|uniref:dipeptide/oligopeptide/nickel ABC transporter permease/ATP-binding protein n=1 Tax=Nakamurella sp. UYEF19 TaxID=1756392 RepID=UPI0033928769
MTRTTPTAAATPVAIGVPVAHRGFCRRLLRKPLAVVALGYLIAIVVVTVLAGWIAPHGSDDQDLAQALTGPSRAHLMGAGELGRDVLSRLLFGGRVTLLGEVISVGVFAVVGIPAGMIAGYRGGWFDRVVLRVADLVYAVPVVIILLVVLAVFPNDETIAMVALGVLGAPSLARVVRSATQDIRDELYVRAAVVAGLSDAVILRRHVLPRLAGPIIVQLSLFGAAAVGLETGLGFLGLGVTQATWGTMVAEASRNLGEQPWLLIPSGFVIITFVLALGLLGDGVRDASAERFEPGRPARRPILRSIAPQRLLQVSTDNSPGAQDELLSVSGLSVTFAIDGVDTEVVHDVSFTLRRGQALGIVGESGCGCGKSVTARALIGLLAPGGEVTAGRVVFDGIDVTAADRATMRGVRGRRIGLISQDPVSGLDPSFTVGQQISEVVRRHRGCSQQEARRRAVELLQMVSLPDPTAVSKTYPHQLSGGMAQRVGIAAALAGDPDLVVADEPTTALDVTVQAEILDLLRTLQESGVAIILVTHDWGVLADLCDRALVVYAGQIVEQATPTTLVAAPGHPYTKGLLRSNPRFGVPGRPLVSIDGVVPAPGEWPAGCHFQDRCPLVTRQCRVGPVPLFALARDPGAAGDDRGEHGVRCVLVDHSVSGGARV